MKDGAPSEKRRDGLYRRRVVRAGAVGTTAITGCLDRFTETEIKDWHDLDAVREELSGDYVLVTDLDQQAPGYDEHVDSPEEGWEPIGRSGPEYEEAFTGTFDGQEHEIANLQIYRPESDGVGLFDINQGKIEAVTLTNAEIVGGNRVGGLAGWSQFDSVDGGGDVVNSSIRASDITGREGIGGLVGDVHVAAVSRCSTHATNVTGKQHVGGVVGWLHRSNFDRTELVESSVSEGTITGKSQVGGLVGGGYAEVLQSSVREVTVAGEGQEVGGLVGSAYKVAGSTVRDAEVTGTERVGGLAGNCHLGDILKSSVRGADITGDNKVGGLVGRIRGGEANPAKVVKSIVQETVINGGDRVGGLIGQTRGARYDTVEVVKSAVREADIAGDNTVGGFIGQNNASELLETWSASNVTGQNAVGGFIGRTGEAVFLRPSYWDTKQTVQTQGIGVGDGDVAALTTEEMHGTAATEHMDALDFEETWAIRTDPDGYPVIQSIEGADEERGSQ